MQSDAGSLDHMTFFHLPRPEYLYQGLLIRQNYNMSSVECTILQLKCKYFQCHLPEYFYQNQITQELLDMEE